MREITQFCLIYSINVLIKAYSIFISIFLLFFLTFSNPGIFLANTLSPVGK